MPFQLIQRVQIVESDPPVVVENSISCDSLPARRLQAGPSLGATEYKECEATPPALTSSPDFCEAFVRATPRMPSCSNR